MKISNPLTIIAIFSSLAEALATVTLINLPLAMQEIFIYFVMVFPSLIVIFFFIILLFNNKALYAPSDFDNQDHYLEINNLKESVRKDLDNALNDIDKDSTKLTNEDRNILINNVNQTIDNEYTSSRREKILYLLTDGPASMLDICSETGIHVTYARLILQNLEDENKIVKKKVGSGFLWSLNT